MSCSVFVWERGNISIKPLTTVCAEVVEIGQDGLRQPLQVQPAAGAADKADMTTVCRLEQGNGFGHFVRDRQHFGGRDHTTVMHANKKIVGLMAEKRETFNYVTELTNRIKQKARELPST